MPLVLPLLKRELYTRCAWLRRSGPAIRGLLRRPLRPRPWRSATGSECAAAAVAGPECAATAAIITRCLSRPQLDCRKPLQVQFALPREACSLELAIGHVRICDR